MPIVPNHRTILQIAIAHGINHGLDRAFKHTDMPQREEITAAVEDAIIAEIDSVFDVTDAQQP